MFSGHTGLGLGTASPSSCLGRRQASTTTLRTETLAHPTPSLSSPSIILSSEFWRCRPPGDGGTQATPAPTPHIGSQCLLEEFKADSQAYLRRKQLRSTWREVVLGSKEHPSASSYLAETLYI